MSTQRQSILIILAVLILSVLIWFVFVWYCTLYAPMQVGQNNETIKVYPGDHVYDLAQSLYKKNLITHPYIFTFAVRMKGDAKKLHFGEYKITLGMSTFSLLEHIVANRGMVKHHITFVEGWTFKEVMQALENDPNLIHCLGGKTNSEVMKILGYPNRHPEGLFLPETYTFIWGNTDVDILHHAYQYMQNYLVEQWKHRAPRLQYQSAYQALIVASLIEKETSLAYERPIIASVILHRLQRRIRLQVDPTVLYGLNKPYNMPILRRDLLSKTPYNTYQVDGLPPTPIDIPGRVSINAALHPANTHYLYYMSAGDGHHIFSKTYQKHLLAVKRYRIRAQHLEDR